MDRRQLMTTAGALLGAAATRTALAAQDSGGATHDHSHHMMAMPAPEAGPGARLVGPLQTCQSASLACIAHCQQLLAQGDTSLSPCLKAALDVNAMTEALLKLAGWSSTQAAPLAKASLPVYLACADACKEHAAHHAQCKACREACLAIIAAVQALG